MHNVTQWKQSGVFEPSNPRQRAIERFTGMPGGYSSFYYNQVDNTANLMGLGLSNPLAGMSTIAQVGIAAGAIIAGYVGYQKFLKKPIKRGFKGLAGALGLGRSRRRRR